MKVGLHRLPLIEQKRSMNGAQFHLRRVGTAGAELVTEPFKFLKEWDLPQHVKPDVDLMGVIGLTEVMP